MGISKEEFSDVEDAGICGKEILFLDYYYLSVFAFQTAILPLNLGVCKRKKSENRL